MRPVFLALLLFAGPALAAPPKPPPVPAAPIPAAEGLVFVATTGLEDPMTLGNTFRHAKIVKESGVLGEVTVVVYARAIQVFDPAIALGDAPRKDLEDARAAGVRIVACEHAIGRWGIAKEVVAERAETVPQGIVEVARLVAAGHEILNY